MVGRPATRERQRVEAEQAAQLAAIGKSPAALELPSARRSAPVEWSEALSDEAVLLGAQGFSEGEIAAHWSISLEHLTRWSMDRPGFSETLARARTQSLAWWEARARVALETGDNRFPAGAWASVMRARFSAYQDRLEVSHSVDLASRLVLVDLRTAAFHERSSGSEPLALDPSAVFPLALYDEGVARDAGAGRADAE